MAGKMREKARDIRKSLFRFFCFCSAATPTADDGEVPRQSIVQSIDMPAQSEMSNGKVLGLTRDFSRIFERREPRQQNVERKAALTSILGQATPSVFVPRQHAPHHSPLNIARKTEIASILEQVAGGPPSSSIKDVCSMSEFIEQRLSFTRSDIPLFQPSQPPAISLPRQQASPVPRQQAPPATCMPHQQSQIGDGKVPHQHAGLTLEGRVPPQQTPPSVSLPHQQATPSVSAPRQQTSSSVSVPHQQAPPSVSVPCQQVPPSVSLPRYPSQDGDRKTEIASILEQMIGYVPSDSIEEVREMYEFIERALSFMRSNLPVFQPSQSATAPRPLFAPRAAGAVFTPGAVFEPRARFGQGASWLHS